MKIKFIAAQSLPESYTLTSCSSSLESQKIGSDGRSYQWVGIAEKNYIGRHRKRFWLGVSAFCKAFFSLGILALTSDKVRGDWQAAISGKRKVAIYRLSDDLGPIQLSHSSQKEQMGTGESGAREKAVSLKEVLLPLEEEEPCQDSKVQANDVDVVAKTTPDKVLIVEKTFPLLDLPVEAQLRIFSFLSFFEQGKLREVCKRVQQLMDSYFANTTIAIRFLNQSHTNRSEKLRLKIQSSMYSLLKMDHLESFLQENAISREEFLSYLTSKDRPAIDWNVQDAKVLGVIVNLFFNHATDEQLKFFITHDACALDEVGYEKEALRYPDLAELFFEKSADQKERLADLLLIKPLLSAMVLTTTHRMSLLKIIYQKDPSNAFWEHIRAEASSYSSLINLLHYVWFFDTMTLLQQPLDKEDLKVQLQDLFNGFKFRGREDRILQSFTQLFLIMNNLLSDDQIEALAWGISSAPLFIRKSYKWGFAEAVLDIAACFSRKKQKTDESFLLSFLKAFVSINANKGELSPIIVRMTTQAQVKAFIEGVNTSSDPWRTLHLSHLIASEKNTKGLMKHKSSAETVRAVFIDCQLAYEDFHPISSRRYRYAFNLTREYLENLQNVDSEDKLATFFDNQKIKPSLLNIFLRSLTAGLIISNTLILKPQLDKNIVEKFFLDRGLNFTFFSTPISIQDFIDAYHDLK